MTESQAEVPGDLFDPDLEAMPEKRALILDAALHVFRAQGFHEARIEDIAAAAGVGKGTIYEYFANKTELYEQTTKYHLNRFWRLAAESVGKGASAKEKIHRILESEVRLLTEEEDLAYVLVQDPGPVSMDLRRWMWKQRAEVILNSIGSVVREGIREGTIREVDVRVTASMIFMAFHALLVLRMVPGKQPGEVDAQTEADTIIDLVFQGIGACPAARPSAP